MKYLMFILSLFSSLYSCDVDAHKLKSAFTIVLFNDRTQNIEVMHRFYLHDAEEAVWELFDTNADIIGSEKTQEMFSQYVTNRFSVYDQNNQPLSLQTLGFQNDSGYFWVYQEHPIPEQLTAITIKHDALRDIWTDHTNIVNIEGIGNVITLQFSGSDTKKSIELPSAANKPN